MQAELAGARTQHDFHRLVIGDMHAEKLLLWHGWHVAASLI